MGGKCFYVGSYAYCLHTEECHKGVTDGRSYSQRAEALAVYYRQEKQLVAS